MALQRRWNEEWVVCLPFKQWMEKGIPTTAQPPFNSFNGNFRSLFIQTLQRPSNHGPIHLLLGPFFSGARSAVFLEFIFWFDLMSKRQRFFFVNYSNKNDQTAAQWQTPIVGVCCCCCLFKMKYNTKGFQSQPLPAVGLESKARKWKIMAT